MDDDDEGAFGLGGISRLSFSRSSQPDILWGLFVQFSSTVSLDGSSLSISILEGGLGGFLEEYDDDADADEITDDEDEDESFCLDDRRFVEQ